MPFRIDQHLHALAVDFLRLSLWLLILALIFVPLERLCALHPKPRDRRLIGQDLGYYYLSSLLPALIITAPLASVALISNHVMPAELRRAIVASPLWLRAGAAFLIGEIGFYWAHRWTHEIPWLWRFHAIHHSPTHLDFMVNTRAHPVDLVFVRLCGLVPIYALGLGGPMGTAGDALPVAIILIATIWGFFIHANLRWRLGPLEWLIASPAFHHWHHTNAAPLNRNYASMLPWLDRVFGTFYQAGRDWPPGYGIEEPVTGSMIGQFVHPFRPLIPPTATGGRAHLTD